MNGVDDSQFDLTVLPIMDSGQRINLRREYSSILPRFSKGAVLGICGGVRSGKTVLMLNIAANPSIGGDLHHNTYYFSSTLDSDEAGQKMKTLFPATCYNTFSEKRLESILDGIQREDKETRGSNLFVFDDFVGVVKPNSILFDLATRARHYSASVVYLFQAYRVIPPRVRTNLTSLILMNKLPRMQLLAAGEESLAERFGGMENFVQLYRRATASPFSFLYCRLDEFPVKAHRNFESTPLYVDE